jgi:hypothetical protein
MSRRVNCSRLLFAHHWFSPFEMSRTAVGEIGAIALNDNDVIAFCRDEAAAVRANVAKWNPPICCSRLAHICLCLCVVSPYEGEMIGGDDRL